MKFDKNLTLQEIADMPCFEQMEGQFIAASMGDWLSDKKDMTLAKLQEQNPTWFCEDILYGLERLQKIAEQGKQYVYLVGEEAHLIHLPADEKKYSTFAILMAGGAYGAVCTMVESLPVAAKLNELGMDCFCLNYRTATAQCFEKGLMPKPLDDVALAWEFIHLHELKFGIRADDYIVGGFSAGGHLAAMWGTPHRGARKYQIPNPGLLLLDYPLVSLKNIQGTAGAMIQTGLLGCDFKEEDLVEYSANAHVDHSYPKVYLCLAEDDPTVPKQDAQDLEEALKKADVPYQVERVKSGGHGYGLGMATPAKGWVERAIHFWKEMKYEDLCSKNKWIM